MIWLTWRQARTQTLIALAALTALAVYLVILGLGIHDFHDSRIVGCTADECTSALDLFEDKYEALVALTGVLLIGVPGLLGLFWGGPLITRELEAGTQRLVWNQSVTRNRWLATKLVVIAGFALIATGVFSWLLTWAVSPYDQELGSRFSALTFDSRDVVPLAYALFGFALGVTVGLLVRRTLPALALTLVAFTTAMLVMPLAVRPHLMDPVDTTVAFTAEVAQRIHGLGSEGKPGDNSPVGIFDGYDQPGAWILTTGFNPLRKADNSYYNQDDNKTCHTGEFDGDMQCLAGQNLHFDVSYHPADRYWTFQWIETAIFTGLAALLIGFCFWRVQRLQV